jgi:hypothetical protein
LLLRVQRLGPLEEVRDADNDQQNTAEKANPELFPYKELHDECDAEARDTAVQHIGRRRSEARDHAQLPSCLDRPANAQDVYRSHGHRNHQPDDYAAYQELDFSHSSATTSAAISILDSQGPVQHTPSRPPLIL